MRHKTLYRWTRPQLLLHSRKGLVLGNETFSCSLDKILWRMFLRHIFFLTLSQLSIANSTLGYSTIVCYENVAMRFLNRLLFLWEKLLLEATRLFRVKLFFLMTKTTLLLLLFCGPYYYFVNTTFGGLWRSNKWPSLQATNIKQLSIKEYLFGQVLWTALNIPLLC